MEYIEMISSVGFPIATAAYLLLRMETKMDKLTEAIQQLTLSNDAFKKEGCK
jgi:hypothetical protein